MKSEPRPIPTEFAISVEISGFKQRKIKARHKSSSRIFSSAFPDVEIMNEFEDWFWTSDIIAKARRPIKNKEEIISIKKQLS